MLPSAASVCLFWYSAFIIDSGLVGYFMGVMGNMMWDKVGMTPIETLYVVLSVYGVTSTSSKSSYPRH